MNKYCKLVAKRDKLFRKIQAYNEQVWAWNVQDVGCQDSCPLRGQPHTHKVVRRKPYIRWNTLDEETEPGRWI